VYRLLHRDYYENFDTYTSQKTDFYDLVSSKLPVGWEISRRGIWFHCGSSQNVLPQQGWKIHVSATPGNAQEVLDRVTSVLFDYQDTDFKFVLDMSTLFLLNSKNWSRAASGKFITIYPPDNHRFLELIEELHKATEGLRGPYILSDHRYKDSGVVFYRYGGMRLYEVLNVKGEKTPMLVGPDGTEIPDHRFAYPVTPPWAGTLLPIEEPQEQGEGGYHLKAGRFTIESVIDFSNAGGVYLAVDQGSGKKVVIKEARPCINGTVDGYDAVELLKKEYRLLTRLSDTGIAPQPIDLFQEWEHWFLVEEYIDGVPMSIHSTERNILLRTRASQSDYKSWYETFRALALSLAEIIDVLHSRNIVFADLSTNNLIVPAGKTEVKLIDFEGACETGADRPTTLFTPGFASQSRLSGSSAVAEDDYYSLGAVLFSYLFPLNGLFHLKPEAKEEIMSSIQADTRLPKVIANMVLDLMSHDPERRPVPGKVRELLEAAPVPAEKQLTTKSPADYEAMLEGIVEHINNVASYSRMDRLFPADPKLFTTNPLSLAYGAAGVAYALDKVSGKFPQSSVDWILRHNITYQTYAPGLYLGMSGIAWSLLEIGVRSEAEKILQLSFGHRLLHQAPDIFYGTAGWGMTCLRFFQETGNELYLDKAKEAGEHLLGTCEKAGDFVRWKTLNEQRVGFAHGGSGIALFLLYLHLVTNDDRYLRVGRQALDYDLSFATETKDGGLSWAYMVEAPLPLYPYWRFGSAGIGMAVLRFFQFLGADRYRSILDGIFIDTDRKYAVFPGRFIGLAGMGDFLLDMYDFTRDTKYLESARKAAEGITHFRVDRGGVAFPGDMISRLCCDYGTGSAGIALFFNRLLGRQHHDFMLDSLFESAQVPWIWF
jgi:serine/threonine protein kinase